MLVRFTVIVLSYPLVLPGKPLQAIYLPPPSGCTVTVKEKAHLNLSH